MAGAPDSVGLSPPPDAERGVGTEDRTLASATSHEDFRVRCTSKRAVTEMLELCGSFVQQLGDALPEEIRELALRDAQWVWAQKPSLVLSPPYPTSQGSRIHARLPQS